MKKGLGRGLGRGLDALITSNINLDSTTQNVGITEVDINKIEPNKDQPRKFFDNDKLIELSESIKSYGVIQPIVVNDEGDYYSIIAGERRYRASRMANLKKVPVIIRNYDTLEALEIALIENLHRADLNPIEEGYCYKRLKEDFFLSFDEIGNKISKSKATISVYVNLLNLDQRVQDLIIGGFLSQSHARCLLKVEDLEAQYKIADKIIEEDLSVRATKKAIDELLNINDKEKKPVTIEKVNKLIFKQVEDNLKDVLGTKVKIKNNDTTNKGKVEIQYYSQDDLDRLLKLFNKLNKEENI